MESDSSEWAYRAFLRSVFGVAAAISAYLLLADLVNGGEIPGCDGLLNSDCTSVLTSRWSKWMGMPVSLPGTFLYAIMAFVIGWISPDAPPGQQRFGWGLLTALSVLALGAAGWFISLQYQTLGSICPYCMAVHGFGSLGAAAILLRAPIDWMGDAAHFRPAASSVPVWTAALWAMLGASGIAALTVGQGMVEPKLYRTERPVVDEFYVPPPLDEENKPAATTTSSGQAASSENLINNGAVTNDGSKSSRNNVKSVALSEPPKKRWLNILGIPQAIDLNEAIVLGSLNARYVVVKVFDYTCPHCRTLHEQLEEARRKSQGQLAVILQPAPLNSRCNRYVGRTDPKHSNACAYARLAWAVWNAKREAFPEFHNRIFDPATPPSPEAAKKIAEQLVGTDLLTVRLAEARTEQQLDRGIAIYHMSGDGRLPKLIIGPDTISGEFVSAQQLMSTIVAEYNSQKDDRRSASN